MNHKTLYIVKKLLEKKAIKMAFLLFAILYSLYEYLWGIWHPDNYYWVNIPKYWQNNPMVFLSLWSMDVWEELFGRTLFANRILAWGMNILSILLAYLLLLNKSQYDKYVYYLCGAIIIVGPGFVKCCTPDCFSSLLLIVLMWSTLRYTSSQYKLTSLVGMTLLSSFAIAVRFPNIVCLPMVVVYLWLDNRSRGAAIRTSILYIVLVFVFYWLLLFVYLDTCDGYTEVKNKYS